MVTSWRNTPAPPWTFDNTIMVNLYTSSGDHKALLIVGANTGQITKVIGDDNYIFDIFFKRSNEQGCIVHIKRGSQHNVAATYSMEESLCVVVSSSI
jgi:hypothetical protein